MLPLPRIAAAVLVSSVLSTAAFADPAAEPVKPAVAPATAPLPVAKPAAVASSHAARAKLAHRAVTPHHLAKLHDHAPVLVASLGLTPPRPSRLVDMTVQRDGFVSNPDAVQIGRPVAQNSCDSLLCSSYIIMGAGF